MTNQFLVGCSLLIAGAVVIFRSMGDSDESGTKHSLFTSVLSRCHYSRKDSRQVGGGESMHGVCFACGRRRRMQFTVLTMGFVAIAVFRSLVWRLSSDSNGSWSRIQ